MWDLGDLRDRDDFVRRLAVTAAALIVYRLGALLIIHREMVGATGRHGYTARGAR